MEQVDRQYEFHRLALSWPQHRWWRPLLTALLGFVFYVVFLLVVLLVCLALAALSPTGIEPYVDSLSVLDLSDPVTFAFTLVSLILMIPALALAVLIMGPRPLGLLSSVAGRIRWRWLAVCTGAALAVFLASLALSTGIGFLFPAEAGAAPEQQDPSILPLMLALSILAVPFQAAAEEYVFRGFLMQAIGSWLRHPAFAILLPVPLFVLGHGYDPLGQTDVAIFAVFAGWITWRTGGLEAAIAVHAINNMTIFVLGAFGLVDVNSTEGTVGGLLVSIATMAVTAVVLVWLANRWRIGRTRTVAPQPMLPPAGPSPAYAAAGAGSVGGRAPWAQAQALPGPTRRGWNAPRYGTAQYDTTQYDPARYDTARYDTARSAPVSRPTAPAGAPAPATGPTRPAAPPAQGASAAGAPAAEASAPGAPDAGAPPTDVGPGPDRPGPTDRHPSGPAHPAGPGHPGGTAHPGGPGHPGADGRGAP